MILGTILLNTIPGLGIPEKLSSGEMDEIVIMNISVQCFEHIYYVQIMNLAKQSEMRRGAGHKGGLKTIIFTEI